MVDIRKHFDVGSLLVMLLTLAFFVAALFFKGLTHDLLLEAGVFLVSVKLIIMSYKNAVASQELHVQLRNILSMLEQREKSRAPDPYKVSSCQGEDNAPNGERVDGTVARK